MWCDAMRQHMCEIIIMVRLVPRYHSSPQQILAQIWSQYHSKALHLHLHLLNNLPMLWAVEGWPTATGRLLEMMVLIIASRGWYRLQHERRYLAVIIWKKYILIELFIINTNTLYSAASTTAFCMTRYMHAIYLGQGQGQVRRRVRVRGRRRPPRGGYRRYYCHPPQRSDGTDELSSH